MPTTRKEGFQRDHDNRICALECAIEAQAKQIKHLIKEMKKMAIDTSALEAKVTMLEEREAAREQRDVAQDAVTQAQIASLTAAVASLQAIIDAGNIDPAVQLAIDSAADRIGKVITSLDAADPTPPVV